MLKTRIGHLFCIVALNTQIFSAEVLNRFSHGDDILFNQLDNGIITLVYSCKNTPNHASFRVIVKRTVFDNIDQNFSFFDNFDDCFSEEEFFPKDYAFIMRSLISSEQTVYALDTSLNDKRIDNFLSFCSKKIERAMQEEYLEESCCATTKKSPIWMNTKEQNSYFLSHELDQLCPLMDPNQVIAIAIGDFELEKMSDLLNAKLSSDYDFDLEDEEEMQTIEDELSTQQEATRYWTHFLQSASLPAYSCSSNNTIKTGSTYQNGVELYSKLPFTDGEKAIVIKIINTLADYNIFELAFHRGELMKKGQKIRHVHPFRFMGLVFSDPILRKNMEKISDSYFKWNGFIDGFSEKIDDEANKNNLMKYLPGLAEHLEIDQEVLAPYILKRDWENLILFLINPHK